MKKIISRIVDYLHYKNIKPQYIIGVPYGGIPFATVFSQQLEVPLLVLRKEKKDHGSGLLVDNLTSADECLLVEDVVTTGSSIREAYDLLQAHNIQVTNIMTILNRSAFSDEELLETFPTLEGFHSLYTLQDIQNIFKYKNKYANKITYLQIKKQSNLCVSIDETYPDDILYLVEQVAPHAIIIKIHSDIIENATYAFYEKLCELRQKHEFLIMDDRKLCDIGGIMIKQYDELKFQPDLITVHTLCGQTAISELNDHINTGIILISSISNDSYTSETYLQHSLDIGRAINCVGFVSQIPQKEFMQFHIQHDRQVDIYADVYIVGSDIVMSSDPKHSAAIYRYMCYNRKPIYLFRSKESTKELKVYTNVYIAAGIKNTTYDELKAIDASDACIVLSKSCTLESRIGNEEPRFYMNEHLSINSNGLCNLGLRKYMEFRFYKPYFISIAVRTLVEFKEMVQLLLDHNDNNIQGLEINLSCPNITSEISNQTSDTKDPAIIESVMHIVTNELKKKYIVGYKLFPLFYQNEVEHIIALLKKYPPDYVTCSNSFANGYVTLNNTSVIKGRPNALPGLGGIGGCYGFKAIALANAYQIKNALPNLEVIGCGGIRTTQDVKDYLNVGCQVVQVGTHIIRSGGLAVPRDPLLNET